MARVADLGEYFAQPEREPTPLVEETLGERIVRWIGFVLLVSTLFVAVWIELPPPTYFLLRLAVGAPELSAWLGLVAVVGILLVLPSLGRSHWSKAAVLAGLVSLGLVDRVFGRLGSTIHDFDAAGSVMMREPASPLRAAPVSALDLFRGVQPGDAQVTRGIVFASPGGHALTVDIYRPPTPGRYPIVVQIYGGSWRGGAPGEHADFAQWLASGGYVVFAIDYRHTPSARWPAQMDDVDSAVAWIHSHANEYEADTTRMVLLGRSAGAHLAMLEAYRSKRGGIRGVVSLYGPIDLADAYRHPPHPDPLDIRPIEDAFIGGPPDKFAREYADASPATYATESRSLPPTLLIYGARDNVVEPRYARAFAQRLNETGTSAAYLEIPWAEHAFDEVFSGVSSQLEMYYTERFLAWAVR